MAEIVLKTIPELQPLLPADLNNNDEVVIYHNSHPYRMTYGELLGRIQVSGLQVAGLLSLRMISPSGFSVTQKTGIFANCIVKDLERGQYAITLVNPIDVGKYKIMGNAGSSSPQSGWYYGYVSVNSADHNPGELVSEITVRTANGPTSMNLNFELICFLIP